MKLTILIITILVSRRIFCDNASSYNRELVTCLLNLIKKDFTRDATIYFISENLTSFSFPLQITNPRIIVNTEDPISMSWNFHYNYIICTNGHISLKTTLTKIKESSLWNPSESPRGKFLVVTPSSANLTNIFEVLWNSDIIIAMVIVDNENSPLQLYTSDPFANGNNCGNKAKAIFTQPCDDTSMRLNETITDLNNCSIKVPLRLATVTRKQAIGAFIMYRVVVFVGQILHTNNVIPFEPKNETNDHYNYSGGIILSDAIARGLKSLVDYDMSEILYRDKIVWAVPKPNKLNGFGLMVNIYRKHAWISIGTCFVVMVVAWWLMAKYIKDRTSFSQFSRSFLAVLAMSLCSSSNLIPQTKTIKLLALFYFFYGIIIGTSFNANLISVLTRPLNSQGITTVDELAESGLPLFIQRALQQLDFRDAYGDPLYQKLRTHFVYTSKIMHHDALVQIVLHRNISNLMPKKMVETSEMRSAVHILETNLFSFETTFYMRKGHYFMPTFNKFVVKIHEHGFYEKFMREAQRQTTYLIEVSITTLSITHLSGVFIFWGIGLMFAVSVFVAELLYASCK